MNKIDKRKVLNVEEPKIGEATSDVGEKKTEEEVNAIDWEEIKELAKPSPPLLNPIRDPTTLESYLENTSEELVQIFTKEAPTGWPGFDELFDKCLRSFEKLE
ncbi:uncharacterized protein LOC143265278 [Megachile rotundata]|uniref:uncharacterized protein LOC143265278 n=1 Tax=Megachile rotundata TaxID=143995 RepID=UPI003FD5E958